MNREEVERLIGREVDMQDSATGESMAGLLVRVSPEGWAVLDYGYAMNVTNDTFKIQELL